MPVAISSKNRSLCAAMLDFTAFSAHKTARWPLLRRIVVLGVATAEQKAKVARLLEEWEAAKKAVEEVQKKIDSLIAELQIMESETANVAQKKCKHG